MQFRPIVNIDIEHPDFEHINGALLRAMRLRTGCSQSEMGELVGLSRKTVSRIENNDASAIDALSVLNLRRWWNICKPYMTGDCRTQFRSYLKKYMNM